MANQFVDSYLQGAALARQQGQAQDSHDMAGLQQISALSQIAEKARSQQQDMELKGVLQQSGGDPGKAIQALLTAGTPKSIELASKLRGLVEKPAGQPIGSGGLRLPDGTIVPPVARPTVQQPSNVTKLIAERDALPEGHPSRQILNQAITHMTNPQAQRIIIPPQPRNLQLTTDASGNQLIVNNDGSTTPLKAPTGEPLRGKVPTNPAAEQLYKDYANHPQVKEANDLEAKIQPLVDYMIDFKKTGKSINANDAALAKAYLATTTSMGNRAYVVDQKQLASLPNLGDRLGNMASSFFAGKDLTDQTRTEMFNYIRQRYQALDTARKQQRSSTESRAKARNVPVEQVFGAENQ